MRRPCKKVLISVDESQDNFVVKSGRRKFILETVFCDLVLKGFRSDILLCNSTP